MVMTPALAKPANATSAGTTPRSNRTTSAVTRTRYGAMVVRTRTTSTATMVATATHASHVTLRVAGQ